MNENENMEQVQETETIQETAPETVIDYKAEFEQSKESLRELWMAFSDADIEKLYSERATRKE